MKQTQIVVNLADFKRLVRIAKMKHSGDANWGESCASMYGGTDCDCGAKEHNKAINKLAKFCLTGISNKKRG